MGPSIKYVREKSAIFEPSHLLHFVVRFGRLPTPQVGLYVDLGLTPPHTHTIYVGNGGITKFFRFQNYFGNIIESHLEYKYLIYISIFNAIILSVQKTCGAQII